MCVSHISYVIMRNTHIICYLEPDMNLSSATQSNTDEVLCKALFNALHALELNQTVLGAILGKDRTTISRLEKRGSIDSASKDGELSTLFLAIYRALFALMGGDHANMRHWLTTENRHLNGIPLKLMHSIEGLVRVSQYLNAIRGKV